jgi:CRISPR-associated protein (TIGR03984 family)
MSEAKRELAGARMEALTPAKCEQVLEWLLNGGPAPEGLPEDLRWALAHCNDGVTWGRYEAQDKRWQLSSGVKPELSPPVRRDWLQQLRLFGPSAEVLIWRDGGSLSGRLLVDDGESGGHSEALRPSDEAWILLGDYVMEKLPQDFTQVGDRAGLRQVLPLAVSTEQLQRRHARLKVRHYWEEDPETGAVRIAATRLVDVLIEDRP